MSNISSPPNPQRPRQTSAPAPVTVSDVADPGVTPGGIRYRAMRAVLRRGPQNEDKEKTRGSQTYWREQTEKATDNHSRLLRRPPVMLYAPRRQELAP